jgi:hypothetical protein
VTSGANPLKPSPAVAFVVGLDTTAPVASFCDVEIIIVQVQQMIIDWRYDKIGY